MNYRQHCISVMRAKWLKFSILPSIKVRVGGQCIAPKTRTTLILDRYVPFLNDNANRYRQTNEFT